MSTQVIDLTRTTTASPATTYRLLADGATWPTWAPIGSFELERAGTGDAPDGETVGAIRVFRVPQPLGPATTSREEVVEAVPHERFAYVLLSGVPLRNYRATIELAPVDGGTAIHWRSTFEGAFPGAGLFFKWALGRFIRQAVDGLAAHAAQLEADRA